MKNLLVLLLFLTGILGILCLCPTFAATLTIDDFSSSDISTWTEPISPSNDVRVTWTTDGNGGPGALQIQEGAEGSTYHSQYALARKVFATQQDWSGYQTLQFDAKIDSGTSSGYSVRVKNNGVYSWIHGFTPTTSGYQTFKFDISGVVRTQIEDIVIYVNRTNQNAGQILKIDNIMLDTTAVVIPAERIVENFDAAGYDPAAEGWSPGLSGGVGTVSIQVTNDAVSAPGALQIQQSTLKNSAFALARKNPADTQDWTDYTTLEFTAKTLPQSGFSQPSSNGFSVYIYNAGVGGVLRAFRPTSTFQTFRIDITGMQRDQINEFLFYVNRTSQDSGQYLIIDDIKLTKNAVPADPPVVIFDDFDQSTLLAPNWDYNQSSCATSYLDVSGETDPLVSKPGAVQLTLTGSSMSAYARRIFTYRPAGSELNAEEPTQDWSPYKSLIFEARIIPEVPARPPIEAGYVLNLINGGAATVGGSGYAGLAGSANFKFYPNTEWQTIKIDITSMAREQITGFRIYINRSDKWFNLTSGQKLQIDNMRVSMEAAPALPPTPELVDDFESGIDTWWRYYNTTGTWYAGGTQGSRCLQITDTSTSGSSAYLRKTMLSDWSDYKTLVFDAMIFNSLTDQGFRASVRNEGTYFSHPFLPSTSWETFKIDLTGDTLNEITGLLYYTNGTSQCNGQQLFVDNIRLSKDPAETIVGSIGAARAMRDYTEVQIPAKVVTGFFPQAAPDPFATTTMRNVFFIEDEDRSSAIPVMVGSRVPTASQTVGVGDKVTVTGIIMTGNGQRLIYARAVSVVSSGNDLPKPVYLSQRAACGYTATDGAGMDNTGLRVTVFGKTSNGTLTYGNRYLVYLNDGSDVNADMGNKGIKVYFPMGGYMPDDVYISVTGMLVNELDTTTGSVIRAIWLNDPMDYVQF